MANSVLPSLIETADEIAISMTAGSDDVERVAGTGVTKLAEKVGSTALGTVGKGFGVVASATVAADVTTLAIDTMDPTHEARSANNGKNVISQGLGSIADGIDGVCDIVGNTTGAVSDTLRKVPLVGGLLATNVDAIRGVGALAQNAVVSTARSFEEASNAVGNEMVGARSTHSEDIGENQVLESDDLVTAIGKQGVMGLFKKVTTGGLDETSARQERYEAAAEYVTGLHDAGTMSDAAYAQAAKVAQASPDSLVSLVNDVRRGDKDVESVFTPKTRELADTTEIASTASETGLQMA